MLPFASVAAAIIMVLGGDFTTKVIAVAQGVAIPLAVAGLFLTMIVRTLSVGLVHTADASAKKVTSKGVERAPLCRPSSSRSSYCQSLQPSF